MTDHLVDERVALWAARLTAPPRPADVDAVAALRARVTADLPILDAAARRWAELGHDLPPTEVMVVGRLGWVRANLGALQGAFDPLAERIGVRRARTAARVLGAQLGAVLGLLSSKVLGQYVLPLGGPGGGGLVVVGPNLLDLADRHGARADDIRRSILLHELIHRLQFDGTDWLGQHLRDLLRRYLDGSRLDPAAMLEVAARLPRAVLEARETGTFQPVIHALLTPEQRTVIEEAQSLMSLLEGHGNTAMELAAEGVVDDPAGVTAALHSRRRSDPTTRILTAVAGLEMKRRQYTEGEAFVRAVIDRAGVAGLNRAFVRPENLPAHGEITDPDVWLDRVGL